MYFKSVTLRFNRCRFLHYYVGNIQNMAHKLMLSAHFRFVKRKSLKRRDYFKANLKNAWFWGKMRIFVMPTAVNPVQQLISPFFNASFVQQIMNGYVIKSWMRCWCIYFNKVTHKRVDFENAKLKGAAINMCIV